MDGKLGGGGKADDLTGNVGSSALDSPGYMNLMPVIQFDYGLWYVRGGMYALADGLGRLLGEMKIPVHLNAEVAAINKNGRTVTGLAFGDGSTREFIRYLAAGGRNVLFVGTKRQAQDAIREEAERCGMFYMNHRWLGGTMTNFRTIRKSIERFKEIEGILSNEESHLTKKEIIRLERQRRKMARAFGGIKDM